MLPNFICPGVQKSATTTLYDILKQHPDIYLPKKLKEPGFFHVEERYLKGINWYEENYYSDVINEKVIGDMSTGYIFEEKALDRIIKDLGKDLKIIIILRNPVDRAYSHYLMNTRNGIESLSFREAIENEKRRIQLSNENKLNYSYFSRGLYAEQIKRILRYYDKKQILIVLFEEFVKNQDFILNNIYDFLEVERIKVINNIKSNAASKSRFELISKLIMYPSNLTRKIIRLIIPNSKIRKYVALKIYQINQKRMEYSIDANYRKLLSEKYKEDIKELEAILNIDLGKWLIYDKV
ncbi:sulfotransferase [Desulfofarcimen acetoxidans DSM 771]|uniref:Sulfotransferase n=1 Tax=Desulfofarcimen acetoxidans (strain ATCC 49208 / DSM 771 / KCTC 5769 / VKM B-1644 / 5575) TaxID=485916 RepID=C8VYQ0_DESAS|nr:sulfotransferase domain-containing protein [Desulfofarcimen acetoxidans]ACV64771.1 sulfotransferase [Desulfofarcimen acetoxidans DSM 771]